MGPARVMPTWTRPTADTGTRPAGGPEPTAGPDTGADGTNGPVAGADADRAHNPTTGPDTRPGADAPGPPRT